MPQRCRRAGRNPWRLQINRSGDEKPGRPGRNRRRDQASGLCEGLKNFGFRSSNFLGSELSQPFSGLLLLLFQSEIHNSKSEIPSGVWCNVSIRVLGTRGDSSTLSSPTKKKLRIADGGLRIS